MTQSQSPLNRIMLATIVAGTLDILAAVVMTLVAGRKPDGMLRFVASGPLPEATTWGAGGAVVGLIVHFTLMAIMATIFIVIADRQPALKAKPITWGIIYGLITYVIMNLIVVPARFGAPLPSSVMAIVPQLLFHIVLVGIPIALIARRGHANATR